MTSKAASSPYQGAATGGAPLYAQLANEYRQAIDAGLLRPGDRMPSMRAFMERHGVSLSTATESYRALERDALIDARPRAGYFVRGRARAALPAVPEPDAGESAAGARFVGIHTVISALVSAIERAPDALNLGGATAAPELYPAEALQKLSVRALRQHPTLLTSTGPGQGDRDVRAVVARRARDVGMAIGPDDIVMTHGCIEGVNLALRAATQPGDTVVVESPCFFGLLQVIESLGLRALEVQASPTTGLSLDALEFALQSQPAHTAIKAVVVVPHLQNPLGSVMPDENKARLVGLCREWAIALLEDDPYRDLIDDVSPAMARNLLRPLKAWDTDGTVIHCTSFNKTLAPGMRVGWVTGGRWHARIAMLKFAQSRHNDPLPQVVLAEYLETNAFERHLRRLRERLLRERNRIADTIALAFPAGTRFTPPRGGMFVWIELPRTVSSHALFEAALAAGVRIMPGTVFSNTGRFDHFIRLSCPGVEADLADEGIRTLGRLAHALAS